MVETEKEVRLFILSPATAREAMKRPGINLLDSFIQFILSLAPLPGARKTAMFRRNYLI